MISLYCTQNFVIGVQISISPHISYIISGKIAVIGGAENDGHENDGPSKCPGIKLTDMKMQDMFQVPE